MDKILDIDKGSLVTLTEKFILKHEDEQVKQHIYEQMAINRDLKSQTIYACNKILEEEGRWPNPNEMMDIMSTTETLPDENGEVTPNYRRRDKVQSSQQTVKKVCTSFSSSAVSRKDWSKNKSKYSGKPELPRCPAKSELYSGLIYTNQCCQMKKDSKGIRIILIPRNKKRNIDELSFYMPKSVQERFEETSIDNSFQLVTITPVNRCDRNTDLEVEITYRTDISKWRPAALKDILFPMFKPDKDKVLSIDIGEKNFATIVSSAFEEPCIIDGRYLKYLNKSTEEYISHKKSVLPFRTSKHGKKYQVRNSRTINKLYERRARRNKDFANKAASVIVTEMIKTGIGVVVVGYNKGIKTLPSTSKEVNQTLQHVPWRHFIDRLKVLCALCGIEMIVHEESYTSKCDALALEEVKKHDVYLGRRVDRDTFVSSTGISFNADVNGALNIMRKALKEKGDKIISSMLKEETFIGSLYRPREVHIYRSRYAVCPAG